MPNPKRRHSKQRTAKRRSHDFLTPTGVSKCPNCDAQTPTYKGRNRGHGRYARRMRYQAGKSF